MKVINNIYQESSLRIGDRVIMNMDAEARGWGRKDVADGLAGIVVGFNRYTHYVGRIYEFGRKPGVYTRNGVSVIAWDDGTSSTPSASSLYFEKDNEKTKDLRREDKAYSTAFQTEAFISELPDSVEIYEHDLIEILNEEVVDSWETKFAKVRKIDWHMMDRVRNNGNPMPIFECEHPAGNRGTISFDVTEVKLHERGDVYKWYNNQRDLIKFETLEAEVKFHHGLGLNEQVRNPNTENYHWPMEDIYPAARDGLIDVIVPSHGMFGGSTTMTAYKFNDESLSKRCNAKLIEGFSK